ncbi:MAG TPA: hypothetical protein VGN57_10925 [Pirellulaceae bacterium]|jgi:hypothetical protein|nr:hypothetical protein [Pirellulaceae bacterium]
MPYNVGIISGAAAFCLANFVLMMQFAAGAFGYIPFRELEAIFLLLGALSFAGAIAVFVSYARFRKRGMHIAVAALCAAALAGIGAFDVYCIYLALLAA